MNTRIDELLDIQVLQSLLDSLYAFSKIPSAILDTEGRIHAGTGWQDVCTNFHRIHPEARKRCIESDLYTSRRANEAAPSTPCMCPHGLVDAAAPVVIDGERIGNVFACQLFLEDPDLEHFRSQAKAYGFDEEKYIDAVKEVPILTEQAVRENLAVVAHHTGMLAKMGLKRTREKETERRLRERVEDYRVLFNLASDGIFLLSLDGTLLEVNESFARMHGYDVAELIRMNIRDLDTPETAKMIPERVGRILGGETLIFEAEHYHKDGHVFPLEVSASLISYRGESCIQCLHRDITERKRAEEEKRTLERQVQQAQKMESLGVLAGGIAHDFNNLLMVVLGHAELALQEISPMSPARRSLTEITIAAQRAADLSRQMLAYAGRGAFMLERVGLGDLVEEMAHLLQAAISKKAILTVNLESGLPPIEADPSQVRQLVMNLIINASEAIGDRSGVIRVSVGATRCDGEYLCRTELHHDIAPGSYVHLEVTDTGIGMDAETRSRIFEPFFSTKFTGRGLGLSAVLGIVRAHRGALKVHSEPGRGTTFKILFPALEDAGEEARPPDSSSLSDWRGKGTILLVDDEESLLALGARVLEHLGFSVLTAADGVQAVELYRTRGKEIDLVLMDLTMPHMDGAEAFGELRRLNPDVPIVLSSGYSHEDVVSRFEGKGLSGDLQKPYTLAKMRETLAGLMPARSAGDG